MKKQLSLKISGLVQGVFYRKYAQKKAAELNLTGFIKNDPDGNVSAVIEGEEESLNKFIDWCWQGPENAQVKNVEIKSQNTQGNFKDFSIKY